MQRQEEGQGYGSQWKNETLSRIRWRDNFNRLRVTSIIWPNCPNE